MKITKQQRGDNRKIIASTKDTETSMKIVACYDVKQIHDYVKTCKGIPTHSELAKQFCSDMIYSDEIRYYQKVAYAKLMHRGGLRIQTAHPFESEDVDDTVDIEKLILKSEKFQSDFDKGNISVPALRNTFAPRGGVKEVTPADKTTKGRTRTDLKRVVTRINKDINLAQQDELKLLADEIVKVAKKHGVSLS